MMTKSYIKIALLVLFALFAFPASIDASQEAATQKTFLSMSLNDSGDKVALMFGDPISIEATDKIMATDNVKWTYQWRAMRGIFYLSKHSVYRIELWGAMEPSDHRSPASSAGLCLGDSFDMMIKAYAKQNKVPSYTFSGERMYVTYDSWTYVYNAKIPERILGIIFQKQS